MVFHSIKPHYEWQNDKKFFFSDYQWTRFKSMLQVSVWILTDVGGIGGKGWEVIKFDVLEFSVYRLPAA